MMHLPSAEIMTEVEKNVPALSERGSFKRQPEPETFRPVFIPCFLGNFNQKPHPAETPGRIRLHDRRLL